MEDYIQSVKHNSISNLIVAYIFPFLFLFRMNGGQSDRMKCFQVSKNEHQRHILQWTKSKSLELFNTVQRIS